MKPLLAIAAFLVVVGCDSQAEPVPSTHATTVVTTTTTLENDTCDRVGEDTVSYLEELIDTLDETRLVELRDPDAWGPALRTLRREGKDLDLRVGALRCDPTEIQRRAFAEADLAPGGPMSARLLELLLQSAPTTPGTPPATSSSTTTTTPVTTTGG